MLKRFMILYTQPKKSVHRQHKSRLFFHEENRFPIPLNTYHIIYIKFSIHYIYILSLAPLFYSVLKYTTNIYT